MLKRLMIPMKIQQSKDIVVVSLSVPAIGGRAGEIGSAVGADWERPRVCLVKAAKYSSRFRKGYEFDTRFTTGPTVSVAGWTLTRSATCEGAWRRSIFGLSGVASWQALRPVPGRKLPRPRGMVVGWVAGASGSPAKPAAAAVPAMPAQPATPAVPAASLSW